ncbi:hypothetical protein KIN20_023332 [Parelaphostrongylus tenuis]|uniref:Uncharacterized protein n=1 Tax=Parelaphostrongylus tenuis TaxID=148309 RepID=A0AAD5QVT0_PARTN|nr:hypothetical protein KIN20_023332 [Parelaphostrongylus tenuis]
MCNMPSMVKISPVSAKYTSISGTLMTANFIMANWSRQMWQDIMNRAVRLLALGPFGSNFFSARGTIRD